MEQIVLFKDKKDCCGCGACVNVCPKNAISMVEDEYGFLYPQINYDICVSCGMCKKACGYQNTDYGLAKPIEAYAAASKEDDVILQSASGGIFAEVATHFLENKGVVYGCSMELNEGQLNPQHIRIEVAADLYKLQGSKYVQSNIGSSYKSVKHDLLNGVNVLFSGTPCQVGGLYGYLGNNSALLDHLFTIDIICHGTPSARFFQSYISSLEKRLNGKITNFSFRDKKNGWGLYGRVYYLDTKGNKQEKGIRSNLSSYYSLFLDSLTYRENCYSCKYAQESRIGDLTIGDYWGIEDEHPDYLLDSGGILDRKKGISCILVNTTAGKRMLKYCGDDLSTLDSEFKRVAKRNGQLNAPSKRAPEREEILNLFKDYGYDAVDRWYYKRLGAKRYVYQLWDAMPRSFQLTAKKVLHF